MWTDEVPGISPWCYALKLSFPGKKPLVLAFNSKQAITKMAEMLDALLLEAQDKVEEILANDPLAKLQLSFWEDLPYAGKKNWLNSRWLRSGVATLSFRKAKRGGGFLKYRKE